MLVKKREIKQLLGTPDVIRMVEKLSPIKMNDRVAFPFLRFESLTYQKF